jgi:hypothetical protein
LKCMATIGRLLKCMATIGRVLKCVAATATLFKVPNAIFLKNGQTPYFSKMTAGNVSQKWPMAIFLKNGQWPYFSDMANGHISLDLQRLGRKTAKSLQTRTTYLLARFSSSHDDNIKTTK